MVVLLTGNEPYLQQQWLKNQKKALSFEAMNYLQAEKLEDTHLEYCETCPMMDATKILVYKCDKFSSTELSERIIKLADGNDLLTFIIFEKKTDKRSKFFKRMKQQNHVVSCDKLGKSKLAAFIKSEVEKNSSTMSQETLDFLLQRIDYDSEDVTLFTIQNWIRQLCFAEEKITISGIETFIPEKIDAKIFSIFSFLMKGDKKSAFIHTFEALKDNEAIAILSLILRNYRIAFKRQLLLNEGKTAAEISEILALTSKQMYFCKDVKMSLAELYAKMEAVQTAVNQLKSGNSKESTISTLYAEL